MPLLAFLFFTVVRFFVEKVILPVPPETAILCYLARACVFVFVPRFNLCVALLTQNGFDV